MYVDSNYENECKRCNVEKWKKALRIAEIRKEMNFTYGQAEQIYNDEKAKKICRASNVLHIFLLFCFLFFEFVFRCFFKQFCKLFF